MGFIDQITDRVIVMNAGREIFEGTLAEAIARPGRWSRSSRDEHG